MKKKQIAKALKLLAIDVGSKRMGLAVWNPEAALARPLMHLKRTKLTTDLATLEQLVAAEQIEGFLVGLPIGLEEQRTQSTKNAEFWVKTLEERFDRPVFTVDESFSTAEAIALLRERGVKLTSKTMKDMKDSISALLFLEEFMRGQ